MRGRGAGWDEEGIVSAMRGAERVMVRLGADTGGPGAGKDGDCGRGVLKKSAGWFQVEASSAPKTCRSCP